MLSKFKQKILSKKISDCTIEEVGENFKIKNSCAEGQINFYAQENIVEMSVDDLQGENKFYLHFELNDLKTAEKFFDEMLQTLKDLQSKKITKILLSCTSGLTTGFFAEKLNSAAKILSLDYEFSAVPFNRISEVAEDFEIILLAPQVSYQFEEIKKFLPNKKVFKIPTKIFASYNSASLIKFIFEVQIEKNIFVRKLITMKKFFEKIYRLMEIAKNNFIEGSKFWCYDNYEKVLR